MARKQLNSGYLQKGFTLIELLVAVSLSVILMMAASTVLISFLAGNIKNMSTRRIKTDGDYALNQMKQQLQNSIKLSTNIDLEECEMGMKSIAFRALDGGVTEFFIEEDVEDNKLKIASNSAVYLTSVSANLIDLNPMGKRNILILTVFLL